MAAHEERNAQLVLELLDLPADRRLGQEQLLPCLGEGQMARRGLEADQQIEGWKTRRVCWFCMPFSHACLENSPFESSAASMHPTHVKSKRQKGRNAMRIELNQGAVRLAPNQTLKVRDAAGTTVCAVEGSVWITEENQAKDIVLERGACYRLRRGGLALVNALGGTAAVSFA